MACPLSQRACIRNHYMYHNNKNEHKNQMKEFPLLKINSVNLLN